MGEVDTGRALAWLGEQWPGVVFWHGRATGRWWAMMGRSLVDAQTPGELHALLGRRLA